MASRFWVTGGTGNWNSTTNWSATTGGASGASVPGSSDAALLDASSGAGTVTLDISPTIQTLTCTGFTGTLAFGTNTISLNSTGTIFTGATTMTVTGTPQIICTNSSATARTITPTTVTEANTISFRINAGTGTLGITAGSVCNLDFTDGVNPTGFAGNFNANSTIVYGNFKASTGMTASAGTATLTFAATSGTKTINTAGVTFDRPFNFNGVGGTWQLQAALTSGATRTVTLTNGTLDLASYTLTTGVFSSNNSNVRVLAFGTGKIVLTGTSGTIFTTSTSTNLTVTGTNPLIQATSGGAGTRTIIMGAAGESNAISVDVTSGSDIISLQSTAGAYKNVSFVGFTGTYTQTGSISIYGNWGWGGVATNSSTASINFLATSGTKTVTSNSVAFGGNVTFNGIGGTWACQDALSVTGTLTLTNGTLQLKSGATSTVGAFATSGTNPKYLQSTTSGTQATISDASGTITVTYLSIKDIAATGGATWNANDATNSNISNNSGWNFSSAIGFGWGLGGWGDGDWGYGDGTFASGSVGNVSPTVSIALTGVNASGQAGTVAPSRTKALTGVAASGAVGSVTETNSRTEDGNVAVGSVGTVVPSRSIALTGVLASGSVGTATPSRTVALTGVSAAGNVGTVAPSRTKALTGVSASGLIGAETPGEAYPITGVTATGSVGSVTGSRTVALTGVSATGSVGTVSRGATSFALTGSAATGSVGTVGVNQLVALTGVNATGSVGDVIAVYWKPIDDTQTPSWQNISNPQTPGWGDVSDVQTPAWEEVVT